MTQSAKLMLVLTPAMTGTTSLLPPGGRRAVALALLLTSSLTACVTAPTNPEARAEFERNNDPAELTN